MDVIHSAAPLYAVTVSLAAAVLIALSDRSPNLREFWTLAAAFGKFAIVASMLPAVLHGKVIEYTLIELFPGLTFAFRVDAFGLFFALLASFLWIVTSFYSIGYVRAENEHKQTRYFVSFAVALSATMGVAFSANLLTMFVFYEILTLCTFPLVGHKETPLYSSCMSLVLPRRR
jgi:multicomponent Na+:H+ antiporter subunit D